jgi:hypothetical protein
MLLILFQVQLLLISLAAAAPGFSYADFQNSERLPKSRLRSWIDMRQIPIM